MGVGAPGAGFRVGLVGYGRGGRYFHAPLIEGAGCTLAGVVTRDPGRRAELAADRPGTQAFDTIAELALSGVDALAITTPVLTRPTVVRQALATRLPLLCDKPFASTAADAREFVEEAERAGVSLTVYQNRRWDADFLTAQRVVGSGELGNIVRFESAMELLTPPDGVTRAGGGMLGDLGTHLVDQAIILFGPVSTVYATVNARPDIGGLDDQFTVILKHASGETSQLMGSQAAHGDPVARFRVIGTEATYVVRPNDGQTEELLAGQTPERRGNDWGLVPEADWGQLFREGEGRAVPAERGDWCAMYRGFADAVRTGGPMPVDPQDAIGSLDVLDAARLSAKEDCVVRL